MSSKTEILPNLPADLFFLTDPYQVRAIHSAGQSQKAWIYGSDTRKRLEVMAQILINNSFEGSSTLVCADPESERELIQLLESLGLDSLFFQLRSTVTSAALASLQLARKRSPKEDLSPRVDLALRQYNSWKEKLASQHSAMHRPVFGDLTWQQLADKANTGPEQTFKSLLAASLKASDFELDIKEYWHLKGRIKTFQRLRVLRTPGFDTLDKLHPSNFSAGDESELRGIIVKKLNSVIGAGRKLLGHIGEIVHRYRRDVSGEHNHILHELTVEIERIEELLQQGIAHYGNEFIIETTFAELTGKFIRSVSRRTRDMYSEREVIIQSYSKLIEHLNSSPFALPETDTPEPVGFDAIQTNIHTIKEWLVEKGREIDIVAITNKKRLNARNISASHELQKELRSAENQIQEYVDRLNAAMLFKTTIEVNALSIEKCGHVIRDVISDAMRLLEAMSDFEAYYLWLNFWLKQPEHVQKLLESLDILEDNEQSNAFDSWYFDNILDRLPVSHMVHAQLPMQERKNKLTDLRSVVVQHLRTELQRKRHAEFKSSKSNTKGIKNAIGSGKHNTTSDELHCLQASVLSSLFPIVFCTPGQLRDYGYYFDTLLVSDNIGGDFRQYQAQGNKCIMVTKSLPSNAESVSNDLVISRLHTTTLTPTFQWNKLPASERLFHLNALASQFMPFVDKLNIYNCRDIQIFSLLGEIADQFIIGNLKSPYKRVGENVKNSTRHVTEALLDSSKPIVILTRDHILDYSEDSDLFWQHNVLNNIESCGIPVISDLSINMKSGGKCSMLSWTEKIRGISETYNMPVDPGKAATA